MRQWKAPGPIAVFRHVSRRIHLTKYCHYTPFYLYVYINVVHFHFISEINYLPTYLPNNIVDTIAIFVCYSVHESLIQCHKVMHIASAN